jgi:hypothetical protein
MFGLDYRSLALLRLALAALILCYLYASVWDLRAFYTDDGVMPRTLLLQNYGAVFSFHMAGGSFAFEAALFAFQAIVALLMLAGYRTRLMTIVSYLLICSLQARNPMLLYGVDQTLRLSLFWAMFLPLGRRYSLDAALGRVRPPETEMYLRIPGVAYFVQFALIYIFSGILKTGSTWQVDHTAIYYALATEFLQKPAGAWLNQYDAFTSGMTVFTPYLEKYGPLLFLLPVWNGWARLFAFALLAVFQTGINVTMWMGLFGPVMIAMMLALLPPEFWDRFAVPLARRVSRFLPRFQIRRRRVAAETERRWARAGRETLNGLGDGVALFLMIYVVLWNIGTIPGRPRPIPDEYAWIARTTGLEQLFDFFAPDPRTDDGWFVIEGDLQNGKTVNAFTGESHVSFERPANIQSTYVNQHWGAYLLCLWSPNCSQHLQPFSQYLARRWNETHSGPEHMNEVRITFMHEYLAPNHQRIPATQELLWTQTF